MDVRRVAKAISVLLPATRHEDILVARTAVAISPWEPVNTMESALCRRIEIPDSGADDGVADLKGGRGDILHLICAGRS